MAKGTPNAGINGTLANGLLAHWGFIDGSLNDESGNGRHLVLQAGVKTLANDKNDQSGQALNLYNSSYYKTNDLTHPLFGLTEWTVCLWVNFRDWGDYEGFLTIKPDRGDYNGTWFADSATSMQVNGTSITRPSNGWHFIIWERLSTGFCKFYIDGVAHNITDSLYIPTNDNELVFGKRSSFPERYPNADFDEIRLYNRNLTIAEKNELLTMGVNYTPDITPPTFNTIYTSNITTNSIDLNINCNENATAYYKLYNRNATSPTSSELKTTHDGTITLTANVLSITNITGLNSYFDYDLYVVAEDMDGNLQTTPSKLQFATKLEYKLCFANEDYSITFTEDTIENKNTSRNLSYRKPINRTNNITFTKNIDKDNTPYVDCINDEFLNYISMEDIFTIKLLDTSTNKIKLLVNCRLNKKPNLNVSGSGNREEISIDFEKAVDL